MKREIVTKTIGTSLVKAELAFVADHFRRVGHEQCAVLFGFAWGNDYYPGDTWEYVDVPLSNLVHEAEKIESKGWGRIGVDDLFVSLPALGIEFRFCHEADLHMSCEQETEFSEFFFQRWSKSGFSPTEWEVSLEGKLVKQIRSSAAQQVLEGPTSPPSAGPRP